MVFASRLLAGLLVYFPGSTHSIYVNEHRTISSHYLELHQPSCALRLLFRFKGAEKTTQRELAVAWAPLALLDIPY
jgi:hypothetical protein